MESNNTLAGLPEPGIITSKTEAQLAAAEAAGELPTKALVCASDSDVLEWCPNSSERRIVGAVISSGGQDYLVGTDGTQYPMIWMVGTIQEGMVAGEVQSRIEVDSGSDTVDHAEILWTTNCWYAGDPDVPDNALASQRFVDYAVDSEVYSTGVDGDASAESFSVLYPLLTNLFFALAGEASYTEAAGNTVTADEMVCMTFAESLGVIAVEIKLHSSRLGSTGSRYRQISVTPYSAAA